MNREIGKTIKREDIKKGDILLYSYKSISLEEDIELLLKIIDVSTMYYYVGENMIIISKRFINNPDKEVPKINGNFSFSGDRVIDLILIDENKT